MSDGISRTGAGAVLLAIALSLVVVWDLYRAEIDSGPAAPLGITVPTASTTNPAVTPILVHALRSTGRTKP